MEVKLRCGQTNDPLKGGIYWWGRSNEPHDKDGEIIAYRLASTPEPARYSEHHTVAEIDEMKAAYAAGKVIEFWHKERSQWEACHPMYMKDLKYRIRPEPPSDPYAEFRKAQDEGRPVWSKYPDGRWDKGPKWSFTDPPEYYSLTDPNSPAEPAEWLPTKEDYFNLFYPGVDEFGPLPWTLAERACIGETLESMVAEGYKFRPCDKDGNPIDPANIYHFGNTLTETSPAIEPKPETNEIPTTMNTPENTSPVLPPAIGSRWFYNGDPVIVIANSGNGVVVKGKRRNDSYSLEDWNREMRRGNVIQMPPTRRELKRQRKHVERMTAIATEANGTTFYTTRPRKSLIRRVIGYTVKETLKGALWVLFSTPIKAAAIGGGIAAWAYITGLLSK